MLIVSATAELVAAAVVPPLRMMMILDGNIQQQPPKQPQPRRLMLGDLPLSSNVLLSPLERISDVGFRRLCYQNGAALTFTEMVYASELVRGKRGADHLIDTFDDSTVKTGVQLLVDRTTARDGHGVDLLKRALERLEEGATNGRSPRVARQHSRH